MNVSNKMSSSSSLYLRSVCFLSTGLVSLSALASGGGAHGHHAEFTWFGWPEKMGDPVGVGYMLINFVVLLFILNKLIFKPLSARHKARSERIEQELDRATKAREEAEALLKKSEERFASIEKESIEILDAARNKAEHTRRRLVEKANKDAEAIREGARQFAARNAARVRAEIEAEVAARAVEKAEATIRAQFGAQDQARLVDAYIREVGALNLRGARA